ncbi:hypothetical protein Nmel_017585 [Mimus melanotis]
MGHSCARQGQLGAVPTPSSPLVSGHLDPGSHRKALMKTGFILLIVGHLSFITGALVHGTVLRFVVTARDATSLHYGVTNSASVIAALLIISCGVSALLLSRFLGPAALVSTPSPSRSTRGAAEPPQLPRPGEGTSPRPRAASSLPLQQWALLALSACSSLCCLCCLLGLLVAIGLTLANQGRVLLAPCSIANDALAPVSRECPFDPTRVYSSTLSLWAISLLFEAVAIFFSIRCLLLSLDLLRLSRCCRGVLRMKVSLQAAPVESPGPGQCLALLRLDSVEIARL